MNASTPTRSLTRQTTIQVAIRIALVVVVATVISYFHVHSGLQTQVLEQLEKYIEQRGVRESNIFLLAQDNLQTFAEAYAKLLEKLSGVDPQARFGELFVEHEDGSTRLREVFFQSHDITGVISKHVDIDTDLQRRLVIGFEMLSRYGPAWQNRFVNLYVTTPEGAVLMFWPSKPWGLNANSWEVNARLALNAPSDDVVLVIDDSERAERESTWSDLYFDYAVNDWMLSTTEPVNLAGRYMISVGHDVLLSELIERTVNNRLEGTYNLIFRDDGRLLAHPHFMDALQARSGDLYIQKAGDLNLSRIFNLVTQRSDSATIVDNGKDNEYLAIAQLQGPGWYLITVFPKAIIAQRAFRTARLILILGAAALLLEIAISFFVLKKQVAEPLNNLMEATNRVAIGDFKIQLDEHRPDEIGGLARSFNIMSRELNARETALNERSAKLSLVNEQLEQELEERKRAEQEIARQREALHQSEKLNALGSLLAGVAHELNNPLSIVVGRAILLEETTVDSKTKASAQKIRQAAERCSSIVKTFLAIARQQPPTRSLVQLNPLVKSAVELVGYGLRTADVETILELAPDLPELFADGAQLTQVFTNLIINAQQALAEVTAPRRLIIATHFDQADNVVRVEFTDNGPGVPAEIQSRIFEPFYTSKPVGVGTGIGLSFSYGVVESHGGKIILENSSKGGAKFIVSLPVTRVAAPAETTVLTEKPAVKPHAVLIVDDEPEIADMLSDLLAQEGHRIAIAASGNEALRQLAEDDYDVILSDIKMPDLDGPGLYKRLQQSYPHLLNRIVFITGDTLGIGGNDFLAQTGRPLIEKPFVPTDVIQVVRQVLTQI